jgi:hypothetical protein
MGSGQRGTAQDSGSSVSGTSLQSLFEGKVTNNNNWSGSGLSGLVEIDGCVLQLFGWVFGFKPIMKA